ncbi:hypothetical protein DXG01_011556 [Tephrocybe rancida]|nr:hypothetical protein DXG01_011556 [Tephrocybe rancida]
MGTVVERTPYDVWVNISRFIPRDVVETLYGVNRSFFQIATSVRYEVLAFVKRDKHTKWLLRNLSDPYVDRGAYVREVKIEPWLVQPSLKPSHKRGARVWGYICGFFDPSFAERQLNKRVQKRVKKDIRLVTDAIYAMPNLTTYSLEWNDTRQYHPELYRAFLSPVLGRIRSSLLNLSLNVPPEMLHTLVPISLPRLKHLGVDFCTKKKSEEEINQIFDSFVVFVNNLYPTLESLSVSSRVPSRSLKLDRFFSMLGSFPHLESFALSIPFDGVHLASKPVIVISFLDRHRQTLKHLRFTTSRCSSPESPIHPNSKFWIRNILTSLKTPYPRLRDLHLAVRPIKADLTPLMKFLVLHAQSLDALTLTERALTYTEVKDILDALRAYEYSHQLKQLRLKLKHLSPALLELLATRTPYLTRLELSFSEVMATAAHPGYAGSPAHSRQEEIRLFKAAMQANPVPFASWELSKLKLVQEARNIGAEELSDVFADCIPALRNQIECVTSLIDMVRST